MAEWINSFCIRRTCSDLPAGRMWETMEKSQGLSRPDDSWSPNIWESSQSWKTHSWLRKPLFVSSTASPIWPSHFSWAVVQHKCFMSITAISCFQNNFCLHNFMLLLWRQFIFSPPQNIVKSLYFKAPSLLLNSANGFLRHNHVVSLLADPWWTH